MGFGISSQTAKGGTPAAPRGIRHVQQEPGALAFGPPFGTQAGGYEDARRSRDAAAVARVRQPLPGLLFIHADDMLP